MPTYRAVVEYDGTNFCGLQFQPKVRTVAGELERVLSALFAEPVKISAAGRTDAGVHASGQVISFASERAFPIGRLALALNGNLPRDVSVRHAAIVPDGFSARFDAELRTYEYRIINRPMPSAFERRFAHHVHRDADVELARVAAADLIGTHDFVAFCGLAPERGGTVRTLALDRHRPQPRPDRPADHGPGVPPPDGPPDHRHPDRDCHRPPPAGRHPRDPRLRRPQSRRLHRPARGPLPRRRPLPQLRLRASTPHWWRPLDKLGVTMLLAPESHVTLSLSKGRHNLASHNQASHDLASHDQASHDLASHNLAATTWPATTWPATTWPATNLAATPRPAAAKAWTSPGSAGILLGLPFRAGAVLFSC